MWFPPTLWLCFVRVFATMQTSCEYQRVQIQFLQQMNIAPTDIHRNLVRAHGQLALSKASVYRWVKAFNNGCGNCKDMPRSGCPTKLTDQKLNQITLKLNGDRTLSVQRLSTLVNLGVGTTHKALTKKMLLKKCLAKWTPHHLTAAQEQQREDFCRHLLRLKARQRGLVNDIVTGDESWMLCYDPESKQASAQWLGVSATCPSKPRMELRTQKVMLVKFFDAKGLIYREFIPRGLGVGGALHLHRAIHTKRPQMWRRGNWWLQHDGAPAHRSDPVVRFLERNHTQVLPHPGYLPDLAPADYWFFARVKCHLKGCHFANTDELCREVDLAIVHIPQYEYAHAMERLVDRWRGCIQAHGKYFE